ncbi:MAG: hypothetical protein ABWW66_04150 [Archaeoglobaceae archaeon]
MTALIYVLIIAGIVDSTYLLLSELFPICPICVSARVLFLPPYFPALMGLLWFSFAVPAIRVGCAFAEAWRLVGVYGVAFLATYALVNRYFCAFCFLAYAIGIAVIYLSRKAPSS